MIWLGISTSTKRGSVALVDGERLLSRAPYDDLQGHAERVVAALDEALRAAGRERGDLDGIACDVGPGSFTGVRVGVALAKGIALALELPAPGVLSLEAMAAAAFGVGHATADDVVVAVIDAKKGEVFLAAYGSNGGALVDPQHVRRELAWESVKPLAATSNLVVVGEIAAELGALSPHLVREPELDLPDAEWIARVATARWRDLTDDGARVEAFGPAVLEPVYLRAPDAKPL